MEIHSLASGSSGNSYVIVHKGRSLLLDAGLSGKQTFAALGRAGLAPASIKAILLTHEHNDHVAGAGVLCRKLTVPLYMTAGTWQGAQPRLGPIPAASVKLIEPGAAFILNDMEIEALPASHDALEPVNYLFSSGKSRGAVVTDTGFVADSLLGALAGCDFLVLEANHDQKMLATGPYPSALKNRVAGERGHLSNLQAARVLARLILGGRLNQVRLAHLSAVNNNPLLARATVTDFLRVRGLGKAPACQNLKILPRSSPGPVLQA